MGSLFSGAKTPPPPPPIPPPAPMPVPTGTKNYDNATFAARQAIASQAKSGRDSTVTPGSEKLGG